MASYNTRKVVLEELIEQLTLDDSYGKDHFYVKVLQDMLEEVTLEALLEKRQREAKGIG